jgi:MurE/MurF fusion protein
MKLPTLLAGLAPTDVLHALPDVQILDVTVDSRRVKHGTLFVAARGATPKSRDGHDFVAGAIAAGAVAVIAERPCDAPAGVPVIVVADPRAVGARAVERICGSPSGALSLCGVTGTNGKTTVTTLLAHIANAAGRKGGVIGTLGVGSPDAPKKTGFTTPEAEDLSRALVGLRTDGFDVIGMEVSSHALATRRADGVDFAAVAFTNLSHDHLDFHGTIAAYLDAKKRLVADLRRQGTVALIPAGSGDVERTLREAAPDAWSWAVDDDATLTATHVRSGAAGLAFTLTFAPPGGERRVAEVTAPHLLGRFNVENALVAAGLALAVGVAFDDVVKGLAVARPPRGRMERVPSRDGQPLVVVDYAHTPDALERALLTARGFTTGRLIVVFGCGGDRDAAKRPVMGRIAADIADVVVITDDNPRSEDGDVILDAIAEGIAGRKRLVAHDRELGPGTWLRQRNRRRAIGAALQCASEGDVVVIAGKGHETDQRSGDVVLPFDDVREAAGLLQRRPRPAFLPRDFVNGVLGPPVSAIAASTFLGVSTDSRAIEPGCLFVPLVGDRFDGHAFVEGALQAGAAAALVARNTPLAARTDLPLYVVDDTLAALQVLAERWLQALPATRIGLTGSNGKTTTKELLAAALRAGFGDDAVLATFGNLNNHIGVPLTALTVEAHHRVAVFEMGMNHLGEIASYCAVARPTIGLVVNMGTAHAGNVGGVEGVARAKAELFEALPAAGVAVVNGDDARCVREAQAKSRAPVLFFGTAPYADVRLDDVVDIETGGQQLVLRRGDESVIVTIPLDGRHNAQNAAGAVAAAVAAGVDFRTAVLGLADVHQAGGRLQRKRRADGLLILDDSYNANPDSMEAGLETLRHVAGGRRRIAVLGEMLELGPLSGSAHKHIGAAAAQSGLAALFVCGGHKDDYAAGAHGAGLKDVVVAADSAALAPLVAAAVAAGDVVLVKGSRGARMERVVEALLSASGTPSSPRGGH